MSDIRPSGYSKAQVAREEEVVFLRERVAELEQQNQKLYQQAFLLQQRLSASDLNEKERAEFISHVAHELRTPLTSIKGYVDLVLEGETGVINEYQRDFLSVVGINAEKLARTIGDLLDVSRLEAGQFGFKPVVTDFRALVFDTCAKVRPQLEAKGILLEVSSEDVAQLTASVDPERFNQALRAVIAHAGQITPPNGLVRLSVGSDPSQAKAIVKIEDEGPGILPIDLERVFTKFWRPQNQAWRESDGPGLGLAIAKTIIEAHEGQIVVANLPPPQFGSIITITLPLINQSVAALVSQAQKVESEPHYAALVITRDVDFGRVIQKTLGAGGFQVLVADDIAEFVSEAPSWQPDLIVNNGAELDLIMAGEANKAFLRGVSILTLSLSPLEQRIIMAGTQAILAWPSAESSIVESIVQIINSDGDTRQFYQKQTILLVSPSSDNLRGLDRILREIGFLKVYRAMREDDALTLARRYPPNWLLLDAADIQSELEEPNNPTLFEILREDQLLQKTPTIVFLRPDLIAPDPAADYRPSFAPDSERRVGTASLKGRRVTAELRRGETGELGRAGTGHLRGPGNTGELKARRATTGELRVERPESINKVDDTPRLYYNIVPKPFLQRRLLNIARRLAAQRNA